MAVLDKFSLKGKVALATGGAGLYGRQIVAALAAAGAQTIVASRHKEPLERLGQEQRRLGYDVTVLTFDQGEEASILKLKETIVQRWGR
ncbi:MAG: SDR family NAD(P)-dependent oxidoreductase, partial [Lentisphaerae bacterium]|nr:SDR family NAD(P)-dependent oxidoreductase [Lentisphaerota bacterium]